MTGEEIRRGELLSRINNVLVQGGLAGQSMASLAKAVGVSRGKLYVYFANRKEVVGAVVDQYRELAADQMATPPAPWTVEALPQWLLAAVLVLASCSPVLLADMTRAYPDERQRVADAQHQFEERFAAYLNEGVANGTFHTIDIPLFLAMIQASVAGLNHPERIGRAGAKPVIKHLVRILTLVLLDEAAAKRLLTQERTQRAVTALAGELTLRYQH